MQTYLDYASATPTDERVVAAMAPYWSKVFGNPSSIHNFGIEAAQAINGARGQVANLLSCQPQEIFFTSGGTESNNLAIIGIAKAKKNLGNHVITSSIEHPSVLNACRALEKEGFRVTYLPADKRGLIRLADFRKALDPETILVSIHLANSEIGVIQDSAKLKKAAGSITFHTDACQAPAYIEVNLRKLGVEALTINGSKLYGPKGIGALYVKQGTPIFPIMYGGGQQQSLRSGTENVPGIVGLGVAAEVVGQDWQKEGQRLRRLRDKLQQKLSQNPKLKINLAKSPRLPNHLSVTVKNWNRGSLVEAFDKRGAAVSAGSACSSREISASPTLLAIGLTPEEANSTLRITLGRQTTERDCQKLTTVLAEVLEAAV